jgi:hypothetical protein
MLRRTEPLQLLGNICTFTQDVSTHTQRGPGTTSRLLACSDTSLFAVIYCHPGFQRSFTPFPRLGITAKVQPGAAFSKLPRLQAPSPSDSSPNHERNRSSFCVSGTGRPRVYNLRGSSQDLRMCWQHILGLLSNKRETYWIVCKGGVPPPNRQPRLGTLRSPRPGPNHQFSSTLHMLTWLYEWCDKIPSAVGTCLRKLVRSSTHDSNGTTQTRIAQPGNKKKLFPVFSCHGTTHSTKNYSKLLTWHLQVSYDTSTFHRSPATRRLVLKRFLTPLTTDGLVHSGTSLQFITRPFKHLRMFRNTQNQDNQHLR